jgi:hypothetical protein
VETGGEEEAAVLPGQRRQVIPAGRSDAGDQERGDSLAPRLPEFSRQFILRQAIKVNVRIKEFNHQPLTNSLRRHKRHVISFYYRTEWTSLTCMNSV